MQTTITINVDVLQKVKQAALLTHYKNVDDYNVFLIEEKLKEMFRRKNDPIFRLRGKSGKLTKSVIACKFVI